MASLSPSLRLSSSGLPGTIKLLSNSIFNFSAVILPEQPKYWLRRRRLGKCHGSSGNKFNFEVFNIHKCDNIIYVSWIYWTFTTFDIYLIRRVIAEQLAQFMVLPNKISFPFVDEVPLKVTSFKLKLNALHIIFFHRRIIEVYGFNFAGV